MHGSTAPLPDGPFSVRLDAAIRRRGLALSRICSHLLAGGIRCTPSTLSLWRHDRARPVRADSLRAIRALEHILETPIGYLRGDAAAREPSDPARAVWPGHHARALGHGRALAQAAQEFGIDDTDSLENVVVSRIARYDEKRRCIGAEISWVVRAVRDGVDRMLVSLLPTPPVDGPQQCARRVDTVLGARTGRRRVFEEPCLVVAEMLLDRTLRRGEATSVMCAVSPSCDPAALRCGWAREELSSERPIGMIVVGARFHPECRPRAARTVVQTLDAEGRHTRIVTPVALDGDLLIHAVSRVHGGGAAIEWSWDEP